MRVLKAKLAELERQRLLQAWRSRSSAAPPPWELCGFGAIAAGIRTLQLLASRERAGRPISEVVLCGIGGSYDLSRAGLGDALEIGSVATDMVGAEWAAAPPDVISPGLATGGSIEEWRGRGGLGPWQLPSELGFPQVVGLAPQPDREPGADSVEPIFESLVLPASSGAKLLTVGIASGSADTAAWRSARFPGVLVEDMEGFAVALACQQFGVACRIWRGISNRVGDRQVRNWRIDDALQAVVARMGSLAGLEP
jgi:futalosine hydrolase